MLSLDAISREYVALAVSLGERDPDSLDYYFGSEPWREQVHNEPPPFAEIRASSEKLLRGLDAMGAGGDKQTSERKKFVSMQLRAMRSRIDLLTGSRSTFDEESKAFFGVVAPEEMRIHKTDPASAQLDRLLPGTGMLAGRYAAFERNYLIPRRSLPAVMETAIAGCRQRTLQHVSLPPGEHVSVEYVSNKPWAGFSRYEGNFHSTVRINADMQFTVEQALEIACHETYPGHHVYNLLRDLRDVQAGHREEYRVQMTFSPQSFASEAAASYAPEVVFPQQDRIRFERDVLFPLAGVDPRQAEKYVRVEHLVAGLQAAEPGIARDYLDGKLEFARAGKALEDEALMTQSDATLKYINEFRTYMLAYTFGAELVAEAVDPRGGPQPTEAERWESYMKWVRSPLPFLSEDASQTDETSLATIAVGHPVMHQSLNGAKQFTSTMQ